MDMKLQNWVPGNFKNVPDVGRTGLFRIVNELYTYLPK